MILPRYTGVTGITGITGISLLRMRVTEIACLEIEGSEVFFTDVLLFIASSDPNVL